VGSIDSIGLTSDPDDNGSKGPSSQGFPYLFGPGGIAAFNFPQCRWLGLYGFGDCVQVPAGVTRYLVTAQYQVSVCALGEFAIILEDNSTPSIDHTTNFLDCDGPVNRIPFDYAPITVTVTAGHVAMRTAVWEN
jgi:hypothetical protein